jgi:predicted transcriptional regulator
MPGTPSKFDYQTIAEIVARVVLAMKDGDAGAVATKIADLVSRVAAELSAEGRLSEQNVVTTAPAQKERPPAAPPPVLDDPLREKLRVKAIRHMTQLRRKELHPRAARSMPTPTVSFVLGPLDCIVEDTVYCRFDGVAASNLAAYVRLTYGLDWEEYLRLAELPRDFPRTKSKIKRALRNITLREFAGIRRSKGRPGGYYAEWARKKRAAAKEAGVPVSSEETLITSGEVTVSDQPKPTAVPASTAMIQPSVLRHPPIVMSVEDSVTDTKIYCLFDGVGRAMITRHIRQKWGMTWDEYLAYCKLPPDYPRVAPAYSEAKSRKMSEVLNPMRSVSEKERRWKREKAIATKARQWPTKGLVDDSNGSTH